LQGFEYVLQEEEYEPVTENERSSYKLDLSFIYDDFQNSWADSMNFYLVEQNKHTKNGRLFQRRCCEGCNLEPRYD